MDEAIGAYPLDAAWVPAATVTFSISTRGEWERLFDPAPPRVACPLGRALHEMLQTLPPDEAEALLPSLLFAANELVDNALRFNVAGCVTLTSGVGPGRGFCLVCNHLHPEAVPALRVRLHAILDGDPADLLCSQVERTVGMLGSGIGYLTLRHDYGARLGWGFEPYSPGLVRLWSLASLSPQKGTTDGN